MSEMIQIDIHKAGGILIQDKKFLIVRSKGKDIFYAPGGKIEGNETPEVSLVRELKEELSIETKVTDLEFFGTYIHPVAGKENLTIEMDVYLVKNWVNEIKPDNEIEEILWIDSNPPDQLKIGSIFGGEVLPRLKQRNLIA
ncbi:MAG: NUDIX domain-containing protein [Candidatus Sungbacteria bacterium]|uniref:8-oxo-dGTP diphosphatase n=1 Tax=Candidatus Sungiibacteriota bacterium TaxID=2750080 RepID=A0A9D6QS86_9BACT|nr:NUDIX domain-containing protein [Candidatus Sungbacteria bacterium]